MNMLSIPDIYMANPLQDHLDLNHQGVLMLECEVPKMTKLHLKMKIRENQAYVGGKIGSRPLIDRAFSVYK